MFWLVEKNECLVEQLDWTWNLGIDILMLLFWQEMQSIKCSDLFGNP
jgi:hypothetical protein